MSSFKLFRSANERLRSALPKRQKDPKCLPIEALWLFEKPRFGAIARPLAWPIRLGALTLARESQAAIGLCRIVPKTSPVL
jgi:hypothetical protein